MPTRFAASGTWAWRSRPRGAAGRRRRTSSTHGRWARCSPGDVDDRAPTVARAALAAQLHPKLVDHPERGGVARARVGDDLVGTELRERVVDRGAAGLGRESGAARSGGDDPADLVLVGGDAFDP